MTGTGLYHLHAALFLTTSFLNDSQFEKVNTLCVMSEVTLLWEIRIHWNEEHAKYVRFFRTNGK